MPCNYLIRRPGSWWDTFSTSLKIRPARLSDFTDWPKSLEPMFCFCFRTLMDNTFRLFSFMGVKTTSAVRYQVNLTVQNKYVVTHRAVGKLLNKFVIDKPLQ